MALQRSMLTILPRQIHKRSTTCLNLGAFICQSVWGSQGSSCIEHIAFGSITADEVGKMSDQDCHLAMVAAATSKQS